MTFTTRIEYAPQGDAEIGLFQNPAAIIPVSFDDALDERLSSSAIRPAPATPCGVCARSLDS
jgi:hypothetical protein